MEIEVTGSSSKESFAMEVGGLKRKVVEEKDQVRVTRKTLQAVLEQCQRAIESISNSEGGIDDDDEDDKDDMDPQGEASGVGLQRDQEVDELCDLLKSRVQCSDFLEKLECARVPISENVSEEGSSWDMVNDNDLWEDKDVDLDQEDYVLVRQEDIVEGIACFMAAYLLSLKQTKVLEILVSGIRYFYFKVFCGCTFRHCLYDYSPLNAKETSFFFLFQDLSPNQLQEALSKTFSVKKKKGKLRKAWDGSKVVYNVASWGATAIGIYQNPLLLRAASKAFWVSCNVLSKLI
uniref:Uncharacterized protein n=1 Tax=Gossypium raimondii TaxID=29730 RepID=A0A0D2TU73_GOSRA|nr:hypothetical protein B456_009G230600 [Gossypium raimondii]